VTDENNNSILPTQHFGLKRENWEELLPADDPKREFILEGVSKGFKLSDLDQKKPDRPVLVKNYFSVFKYRSAVEAQILEEIENGRYIFSKTQPRIVSALGAIPKKNGGVRLIHDCSKPSGMAVMIRHFGKISNTKPFRMQ